MSQEKHVPAPIDCDNRFKKLATDREVSVGVDMGVSVVEESV